jgi:hypothetical protein
MSQGMVKAELATLQGVSPINMAWKHKLLQLCVSVLSAQRDHMLILPAQMVSYHSQRYL